METHKLLIVQEAELVYHSKVKPSERPQIKYSSDAADIFRSIDNYNKNIDYKECFYAMYLNNASKVLSVVKISEGGSAGTVCDVKMILQPAIMQNAAGIIVSHNHPSGSETPSKTDKEMTKKLKQAAKFMDIDLLDHIILTSESFFSFANQNLM